MKKRILLVGLFMVVLALIAFTLGPIMIEAPAEAGVAVMPYSSSGTGEVLGYASAPADVASNQGTAGILVAIGIISLSVVVKRYLLTMRGIIDKYRHYALSQIDSLLNTQRTAQRSPRDRILGSPA